MDKKELIKKLLKHQVVSMAHVRKTLEIGIFDEDFIGGLYRICEIDTIVLDYIPIPKDNTIDTEVPDDNTYCRDWHFEQLSAIAESVKFNDFNDIINDKEIDLYLHDFLEEVYKDQIQ